LGQKIRDI